ncbi:MAG: phosphate acyltransferase PlsX [Calditrichia bacterium]
MRIVIDAMGGDHAPNAPVQGALLYDKESNTNDELLLVGDKAAIEKAIADSRQKPSPRIKIIHASEVIDMNDQPTTAVRQKKDSSMVKGTRLQKDGEADAFVSAGSTGAQMASSLFTLGRVKGVSRPSLGAFIPSEKGGVTLLIDVGANSDCKPLHLLQFGLMGSIYMGMTYGIDSPKVGLLNIGAEKSKGNELAAASYELLSKSLPNFTGNVEGRDVLNGDVNVVVTDGFTGNVVLKFAEGIAGHFQNSLKQSISENFTSKIGGLLLRPALRKLKQGFDYEEYGGIPLLGVDGISIICHGSSSPKALKNAIRVARRMGDNQINKHIEDALGEREAEWDEKQSSPA